MSAWCDTCGAQADLPECPSRGHTVLDLTEKHPENAAERPENGLSCPTCTPGAMEAAVRADLARLGPLTTGVRGSLASLALVLARTIDGGFGDPPTPAQVAQLSQQLRTTLQALSSVGGQDGSFAQQLTDILSSAVGNPEDPFTADAWAARRANRRSAGEAPHAVADARSERGPGNDGRGEGAGPGL